MRLSDLAAALGWPLPSVPTTDPEVTGVTHRADWTAPGNVFVAIRGQQADGHQFLNQAAQRGAVAAVGEGLQDGAVTPLPYLSVPTARTALADAAALLAGSPSQAMTVIGVTGTDGKTTTAWLTAALLRAGGMETGLLSSAGYQLPDGELRHYPAHFTTPEAPQLQGLLAQMRRSGAQAAVIETSSHALTLERVRGVAWDAAVWTHLSREHLDFHGSLENYFAAKRRLIEAAPFAVLNADDPWTERLRGAANEETTYSAARGSSDWRASDLREEADGRASFLVDGPAGRFRAALPLTGHFQMGNALAAMAVAWRFGASAEDLQRGLSQFEGPPGRMQLLLSAPDQPRVISDSAHTPDSLSNALQALRPLTAGQLWVIVGSAAGGRDSSKWEPMAAAATALADRVILTEADHRDTPLNQILDVMAAAATRPNFKCIGDRAEAIAYAVQHATPLDTVLIANKGGEHFLQRGQTVYEWSDAEAAQAALRGEVYQVRDKA
ncbi:Mur ligase family protein [Deinococcus radiophilus]|uniref:UDP-N-acetylmuramyl-tripeptide synthetase n=1 Tax=Deinococcus radiophilus TaxID=32062 RepID=A0A3S0IKK5_9DEIO|nr:UDP-N-acetylmuramyl-tripeptide synthetase [Deinococcus radiophilus]RTR26126.1 UDP-N-acetylmuramyl-tripeptide synthetase [Deinococcus radiophilus]UFA51606.1 UDP-N-acetylmuramyl-tripeptide synthetase [Deinococcus radiophilus]